MYLEVIGDNMFVFPIELVYKLQQFTVENYYMMPLKELLQNIPHKHYKNEVTRIFSTQDHTCHSV